ncbi:MAG: DUF3667 domain-containing protein [Flavobacteriaceae bacterium]|nr:DUF3667 domain-containing protein [Flavobacteriaceae bacterium]
MNNSEEICRSCNTIITENYCANCGQRRFRRIDRGYVLDEFRSIFIASNKGFFYTLRKLIQNPGKTAREYIQGNRQKHYKPILLSLLLATIAAFISFQLMDMEKMMNELPTSTGDMPTETFMEGYMGIIKNYYSLMMVGIIPLFALASWMGFKKYGDNYYEHIVANAFFQSLYTLVTMFLYPFYYFFSENTKVIMLISSLVFVIAIPLYLWFMFGFYADKKRSSVAKRVLLTISIIIVFFGILFVILTVLFTVFLIIFKPKLFEK